MDFTTRTDIDRKGAQRSVPMRCLVVGMPRTGTNSLRDALKSLGFDECYHQSTLVQNPKDGSLWLNALEVQGTDKAFGREEWDSLLGHCQAVSDIPAMHFSKELMDVYPEAKVILTTRDVNQWHNSVLHTIEPRYRSRLVYMLSLIDHHTWLWASVLYRGWGDMFNGDFEKYGRQVFKSHEDAIRKHAKPGQLLEYHVKEGWEPLCSFLDVPVPTRPFPSGNDQGDFHQACQALDRSRIRVVVGKLTLIGLGITAGVIALNKWRRFH